jgi:hypothetical protein
VLPTQLQYLVQAPVTVHNNIFKVGWTRNTIIPWIKTLYLHHSTVRIHRADEYTFFWLSKCVIQHSWSGSASNILLLIPSLCYFSSFADLFMSIKARSKVSVLPSVVYLQQQKNSVFINLKKITLCRPKHKHIPISQPTSISIRIIFMLQKCVCITNSAYVFSHLGASGSSSFKT